MMKGGTSHSVVTAPENTKMNNMTSNGVSNRDVEMENGEEDSDSERVQLKPKLNLINGCTVIVGSIIGGGIFISPSGVLKNTGSVNMALVVWVIAGIFSMIGAYCYTELGCMIKKTGADYAYIMVTFGKLLAFVQLWAVCIIVRPANIAIVALTFSMYATKPLFPECDPPDSAIRMLAAVCICTLGFVNCWDVKCAIAVQDIFTYAKLLALFIIIMTGLVQLARGKTEYFTWDKTETDVTKLALSFYSGLFAYNGWNYLNFIIEELQDPIKNLPRAVAISVTLVMFVYVMTNVAFYSTLSVPAVLGSEAVAVTFAQIMYGYMAFLIPVFVALSTFGSVNGTMMTSSRLFWAGAYYGQMPEMLAMIQVSKMTPVPSVVALSIMSLLYLLTSDINKLITYVGFATWIWPMFSVIALLICRWKHPDWERPIKVPFVFPVIYIVASFFIIGVPMFAEPVVTGVGLLIILSGIPVYLVCLEWTSKPVFVRKILEAATLQVQRLIIVVYPEKEL